MTTATIDPGPPTHGSTALGDTPHHPRHLVGSALHAIRVFAQAAFEVVVLGNEGKRY